MFTRDRCRSARSAARGIERVIDLYSRARPGRTMSLRRGLAPARASRGDTSHACARPARGRGATSPTHRRKSCPCRRSSSCASRTSATCAARCAGSGGTPGSSASGLGRSHRRRARAAAHPGAHRPRRQLVARGLRAAARRARADEPVISLFGGEPFLYPDILPLMREVKRRGLTDRDHQRLAPGAPRARAGRVGIDTIAVSVDGPPEVHDRIRGQESASKAAAGVRAVAHWRRSWAGAAGDDGDPAVTELNIEASARPAEPAQLPLD